MARRRVREVEARLHAELRGEQGEELVTASVGPTGEAVVLWARVEDHLAFTPVRTEPNGVRVPLPRSPYPVEARVATYSPKPTTRARVRTDVALPHVQPLPDGRTLFVGTRCHWRPGGPDANAVVHDEAGGVEQELVFGDGINHVRATASGRVWVGYFDEGVYGNHGWGGGSSASPVGRRGLVRFAPFDSPVPDWEFTPPSSQAGAIDDCYALNVSDETAWAYYYSEFPVVCVRDGVVREWLTKDISGARAVAADGDRVALFGGYRPHRDRLVVGRLRRGRVRVEDEYRVVLPGGLENPYVVGQGPDLHLFHGQQWFRIGLDDLQG